jgi:hypothetical protein
MSGDSERVRLQYVLGVEPLAQVALALQVRPEALDCHERAAGLQLHHRAVRELLFWHVHFLFASGYQHRVTG